MENQKPKPPATPKPPSPSHPPQSKLVDEAARKKTRRHILTEIHATEQKFVANLNTIIEVYMKPLHAYAMVGNWTGLDPPPPSRADITSASAAQGPDPLLSAAEIEMIFAHVEHVLKLNTRFLTDMEEAMDSTADGQEATLGPLFLSFAPFFRIYLAYYTAYPKSRDFLKAALEKRPQVHAMPAQAAPSAPNAAEISGVPP